jgi:hypothetical protein
MPIHGQFLMGAAPAVAAAAVDQLCDAVISVPVVAMFLCAH